MIGCSLCKKLHPCPNLNIEKATHNVQWEQLASGRKFFEISNTIKILLFLYILFLDYVSQCSESSIDTNDLFLDLNELHTSSSISYLNAISNKLNQPVITR